MAFRIMRAHSRHFVTGRPQLVYVPWKTKEEIIALHAEDATRWNVSTLSARFNAPRENVEGIIRLGGIRREREKMLQSLDREQRERIIKAREKAMDAWKQLAESVPMRSTRGPARPSQLRRPAAAVEGEIQEEDADKVKAEEAEKAEESDLAEVEMEIENSPWAEYIEKEADNFVPDVPRRTTYAFVEVGDQKEGLRRAVWLRDVNGKIRIADEAQRKLLLNEEGARDSSAWK